MSAGVEGLEPLLAHLVGMARRANNPRPAISDAVDAMIPALDRSYDASGLRRISGVLSGGWVRGRITSHSGETVNPVIYGPRHHFGYKGKKGAGRGHATTPARPFAYLDAQAEVYIGDVIFMPFIIYG